LKGNKVVVQILVYGDSLSWGIIPGTRRRLPFEERWPGVMELAMLAAGHKVRVIEDCLNGRRTVWEDPFKAGRNGLAGLEQKIETHSPLALLIVMLGTNDFQTMHTHNAFLSAQGLTSIVRAVRRAPIEPGMPIPEILLVAPPPFGTPKGPVAPKFLGAAEKSAGLAKAFEQVAAEEACHFFDAGGVTGTSLVDGVHLDADQHAVVGRALAGVVGSLWGNR
jgi:lysophospholipase L1-like esterase